VCSRDNRACKGAETIRRHIETIDRVRARLAPLLALMSSAGELNPNLGAVLGNEDLGDIGIFLRDELAEVFEAVDAIDGICRRNFGGRGRKTG